MKTKQEIFDIISKHLLTQGERCVNTDGDCQYRGVDDLKCAIGCLITDDAYHEAIEGLTVIMDVVQVALVESGILIEDSEMIEFLRTLQSIHDRDEIREWGKELSKTAIMFDLKMNQN